MKLGDVTNTVPTIGFTVENVAYKVTKEAAQSYCLLPYSLTH